MSSEEVIRAMEQVTEYLRHLHANPTQIGPAVATLRFLRSELTYDLAHTRRLIFLSGRREANEHPDVRVLRQWLEANPIKIPTQASTLNSVICHAIRRPQPFGSKHLREALESLGYIRTIHASGTFYAPRT